MNRDRIAIRFLCAAALTGSLAFAQQPAETPQAAATAIAKPATAPTAPLHVPIHSAPDADGNAYGIWAAGARYKVSFADGARFVPILGRQYPTVQSLRWRTASASVGEHELCRHEPRLAHDAYRAEYDLGDIVEAYDVRPDGLEQTFVIATRPHGTGDLVIRGEIATAMHADDRAAAHAAIDFRDDDGVALVRYGAATAIDADGRSRAMTTAVRDGVVTLRLDGEWLQQAAFPLVVDPIVSTLFSLSSADVIEAVDVLRDTVGSQGNNWRVAVRFAAADDADIALRRFDDDGSNVTLVFADLTSIWSTPDCSLGQNSYWGWTVLAFSREFSNDTRKVYVYQHHRSDFTVGSATDQVSTPGKQTWRPDVGTDLGILSPESLLIVFQLEDTTQFFNATSSEVWGATVDLDDQSVEPPFLIAGGPLEDYERPAIGKLRNGSNGYFTVANEVIGQPIFSPHVDTDIELRQVDRQGNISSETVLGQGNGWHDIAPRLSGLNNQQLVVYPRSQVSVVGGVHPSGFAGMEIVARRHDWNGSTFTMPFPSYRHEINADPRLVLTGIDFDRTTGSHYVMSYRSTSTGRVYIRLLGFRGHLVRRETVHVPAAGESTIAGAVAYDDDNERFLIAYGVNAQATNTTYVDVYEHPSAMVIGYGGIGCSPEQLSWVGSQLIGDSDCRVVLDNLPAGAPATVLAGLQSVNIPLFGVPFVPPGCWLLVPNTGPDSLGFFPVTVGPTASWSLNLPESLPEFTLLLQGLHFDATLTDLYLTDMMTVPLVK